MTLLHHHFTVDVEEHFHASALEPHFPRWMWEKIPSRVDGSTARVLGLLDEAGVRGTFFFLGLVARRHPDLVRAVAAQGHEVASHGWDHRRVTDLRREEFRTQARTSKALLEDLSGCEVRGFRAPSFSILPRMEWALEILVEEQYQYDSSLYPVRRRGYGYPGGRRDIHVLTLKGGDLIEVPPATLRVAGANLPVGGGGTFRQFPFGLTRFAFEAPPEPGRGASTFYIHPWELDPAQPRPRGVAWLTRARHYRGLERTEDRLRRLLSEVPFWPIAATIDRFDARSAPSSRVSVPVHS